VFPCVFKKKMTLERHFCCYLQFSRALALPRDCMESHFCCYLYYPRASACPRDGMAVFARIDWRRHERHFCYL
jgi:hypothetical protein